MEQNKTMTIDSTDNKKMTLIERMNSNNRSNKNSNSPVRSIFSRPICSVNNRKEENKLKVKGTLITKRKIRYLMDKVIEVLGMLCEGVTTPMS